MPDNHDPSSIGSPDILLTRLLYYIKCQSRKREIIQPNIYGILPKLYQVTYTLDTICQLNIMLLALVVLQIFCWQGSIGLQCKSWKRVITLQWQVWRKRKKYGSANFSCLFHILNFKSLPITLLDCMQSVTDTPADRDGQA